MNEIYQSLIQALKHQEIKKTVFVSKQLYWEILYQNRNNETYYDAIISDIQRFDTIMGHYLEVDDNELLFRIEDKHNA